MGHLGVEKLEWCGHAKVISKEIGMPVAALCQRQRFQEQRKILTKKE